MEKALSKEDRIKRAEEIYYKRRNNLNVGRTAMVNLNPKKEYKLFKKMIIQILICVLIYIIIHTMLYKTDNFSIDSVSYIKSAMTYDVDIEKWFDKIRKYVTGLYNKKEEDIKIKEEADNVTEETLAISEEKTDEEMVNQTENDNSSTIEEASSISQMEQDATYIKENFSLIKPVSGTITSRFGLRNPTTATVPTYHTGIDIGVEEGTVFVASMEGTVELVSSEGDYRKSYKNNQQRFNDTICTL